MSMKYRGMLEVFVDVQANTDEEAQEAVAKAICDELMKIGAGGVSGAASSIIVWPTEIEQ